MSQRNLKCTVCSCSHSRLRCTFICKSCGGDYRQCECETVNRQSRPNKRRRNAEALETDSERSNKELQKRYDSLLKDHERLAQAFRNQEKETKLLGQHLEEKEKEYEEAVNNAEEMANLVRTRCEAIKTLEKSREKTRWGQNTHCKLKTRASVSKEQFFSQRTAASRPKRTHLVFWKPCPAVELKKDLSVTKHGLALWAQRKPNTGLEIYKAFQDRLTCLNGHMIV